MAERFDKIPDEVKLAARGGSGKYPWEQWLDGNAWKLKQGEDFVAKPESFISTCHGAAVKRGLKVTAIRDRNDPGVLWVQAKRRLPQRRKDAQMPESERVRTSAP